MATPTPTTETKTYRGNCHCGAYVYEVELPADLKDGKASECNCSVCYKRGAIWGIPAAPRFLKGDPDTLSSYSFGRMQSQHKVNCARGFRLPPFCSVSE